MDHIQEGYSAGVRTAPWRANAALIFPNATSRMRI